MMAGDDDDLHGDLANRAPAKRKFTTTLKMEKIVVELRDKIKFLDAENATLKRNICMLFRTSRSEIERKDDQIELLTKQLEQQERRASESNQGGQDDDF